MGVWLARLKLDDDRLIPVIAQDATTRAVLLLAWMNVEALRRTLATRRATYWSRSRQTYWVKGETSGHTQHVREARLDCDGDTVLLLVDQQGPACHTGADTCFDAALVLKDDAAPADD
ncbi:MAG: phosphoribosyl-AMP cyclohydrolase [Nocardioidaceae bacterium]|nr:phosphoribosyl-AMP cyclohydrolase [Nocardioidaceae bacterium]